MSRQAAIEPESKHLDPPPAAGNRHPLVPARAPRSTAPSHPRRPSRFLLRFFDLYLSLYVPLHFNALRLACAERFPLAARPLIVVINHPSWWDPLTSILISRFLLRSADHYAPIDALSLPRHRILAGLGLFPVEQGTPRGAVQFLRAAHSILADPNALLWLTPQGSFTDTRTRPVILKAGVASLIKRLDDVTVVPLAYEYTFWNEPKPEMLALCGEPLTFRRGLVDQSRRVSAAPVRLSSPRGDAHADPGAAIAAAIADAQDQLAALAATRDPRHFATVMAGETSGSLLARTSRHLLAALRAESYRQPDSIAAAPGKSPRQP